MDAEDLGGERLVAPRGVEDASDVATLDLLEGHEVLGRARHLDDLRRVGGTYVGRQVLGFEVRRSGQRDGALDYVCQLAHVPRPRISGQLGRKRGGDSD